MKILSLGLDNSLLDKHSALARRIIEYGGLVEFYTVIVPSQKNENIELSAKVKIYGSGGGNKLTQLFKIYNLAKRLLRDEGYNVITVQDQYYLALIGLWLAKKIKAGLEIQVHGFEKFSGLRKLIAQYVLPHADAVRCVSQRLKKKLVEQFDVKEEKLTVVPIHSELRIKNYELRIKKNGENFIFLTVGRLVAVKNIDLQIRAMAEIVKKYPATELWIIGDGPERKNYELEKNIKLFGRKDNLDEYYSKADAFLLTSTSEGWGLAVIEAASFSLPIIMTDVGCAGEVIKDGVSGLVIPADNKQKLVEAMLKIIEDQDLRKRLGDHAKMAVSRLPSKTEILDLYKASWHKALAKKS
ncbi:MAG: glycosyltransferase family 4 protein [bacterium]|nr:glycosyltransferase family 4 protein [bacterium]